MEEYKSNINVKTIFFLHLYALIIGVYVWIDILSYLSWETIGIALSIYIILLIAFTIVTNNDIKLYDDKIEIVNRFLHRGTVEIDLIDIDKIFFKKDSWINIFSEYKYLIIIYKDKMGFKHKKKVYCFGIRYHGYEDPPSFLSFESLYEQMGKKQINVSWT